MHSDGERGPYTIPAAMDVDDDRGFVSADLATPAGHVWLQGDVELTYDSVLGTQTVTPAPNYFSQGCARCCQKGKGCSGRLDGHPGCAGCKAVNQKCSLTHTVEEALSARDEHFDAGLQGHNGTRLLLLFCFLLLTFLLGLVSQLEGMMGTLASLQSSLDMRALADQSIQRLESDLEKQRKLFKRSVRDPRIICALLRLLHPSRDVMTPEALSLLLTALQIPHSGLNIHDTVFRAYENSIQVVDKTSNEVLASEWFQYFIILSSNVVISAYRPTEQFLESAAQPFNLQSWLEKRVGTANVLSVRRTFLFLVCKLF
jgi:hypothetical protein